MKVIKAPGSYNINSLDHDGILFLAGSIEMGTAEKWQDKICKALEDTKILILNPRRDDWDSTWIQSIENPQFNEQVTWELDAMSNSDVIAMYFDPNTKSPITLLELGLHSLENKLIVCCPEGFWRKGNVDIVCARYGIPQVNTIEELVKEIKNDEW